MKRASGLIALCVFAAVVALALPAAGREGLPGYGGWKLCKACHQKTHEKIVSAFPSTAHASALWAVSDQNDQNKLLGDFAANPGFTLKDVAWVLGKGVRAQSYLDASFNALPQEWNAADKKWQPGQLGDAKQSCLGCHTTGYDASTAQWSDAGVTCEACHGPGANHAKSSDKLATIVRPGQLPADRRAMICGHCHSRGKNLDGLALAPAFVPGQDLAAQFTLDAETALGARNSQYNDLVRGKHLGAGVTCTDCHDPHGATGLKSQLLKPADELCLGCHPADKLTGAQHTPPKDCIRCHMPKGSHRFEAPQAVPPAGGAGA